MKKLTVMILALSLTTALFASASIGLMQEETAEETPEVTMTEEPEANAIEIVQAYYDALNAGMLDEALSYVAEDAEFINPTGKYVGIEEIGESLEGLIAEGITFELDNFEKVLGRVTYSYAVMQDDATLDIGEGGLTIVRDEMIVFDGTVDSESPVSVVRSFYDLINLGMLDEAMMFVAEDAQFINPTGSYDGYEEIKESLASGIIEPGITFELSEFEDEDGRVTYSYVVMVEGADLDTGDNGLTIVSDNMIIFDGTEDSEPEE